MLIDTHCHINLMVKDGFESLLNDEECQRAQFIIEEAQNRGIEIIVNVGTNLLESINSIKLAQKYPSIFAAIGIHPNDAPADWQKQFRDIDLLAKEYRHNKIVGIGECGIDRHYEGYDLRRQKDAFKAQIVCALENDLALIVHTRDAEDETLSCLDEFKGENIRGVIHCFSGNIAFAHEVIKRGFLIGVGGTVTYPKNEVLREVVRANGLESMVLETDAPYLPPQTIRGKRNSPAQIHNIADYIAELLALPIQEVALTTSANAQSLFRFDEY